MTAVPVRKVALVLVAAVAALGCGFLIGYPAQVAAAAAIAFGAVISVISTRELADRAELRSRHVRVADSRPLEQLREFGEALTAAQTSEFALDRDLRPLFRSIAGMRLARRGVDLDGNPEEARAILGEQLWELVRSGRARGSNLFAGGVSSAGLQSLIERLEQI